MPAVEESVTGVGSPAVAGVPGVAVIVASLAARAAARVVVSWIVRVSMTRTK